MELVSKTPIKGILSMRVKGHTIYAYKGDGGRNQVFKRTDEGHWYWKKNKEWAKMSALGAMRLERNRGCMGPLL